MRSVRLPARSEQIYMIRVLSHFFPQARGPGSWTALELGKFVTYFNRVMLHDDQHVSGLSICWYVAELGYSVIKPHTHFKGLDVVPLHPDLQQVGSPDLASRITWVQANLYVTQITSHAIPPTQFHL